MSEQRRPEHEIPRIDFYCYVCRQPATTYEGCLTTPPDPDLITRREDISPVQTCGGGACQEFEYKRQDALFQAVMRPMLIRKEQERREKAKEGK